LRTDERLNLVAPPLIEIYNNKKILFAEIEILCYEMKEKTLYTIAALDNNQTLYTRMKRVTAHINVDIKRHILRRVFEIRQYQKMITKELIIFDDSKCIECRVPVMGTQEREPYVL